MENLTKQEFLTSKNKIFYNKRFEEMDLSNYNLKNYKFMFCDLSKINLENCNMENCSLENSLLDGASLKNSNLKNANLTATSMRSCNLENCNLDGTYFYSAILENANLKNIITSEKTKWLDLYCPEKGAFIAYKKCIDNRLVTLLIPNDALRTSATMKCCRTNKAKVLKITDFNETVNYDEAWSFVDENFCYKVGEIVEVKNFNNNRWFDSTTGIHFWMTKEDAKKY